jgi:polyferredoxin
MSDIKLFYVLLLSGMIALAFWASWYMWTDASDRVGHVFAGAIFFLALITFLPLRYALRSKV